MTLSHQPSPTLAVFTLFFRQVTLDSASDSQVSSGALSVTADKACLLFNPVPMQMRLSRMYPSCHDNTLENYAITEIRCVTDRSYNMFYFKVQGTSHGFMGP